MSPMHRRYPARPDGHRSSRTPSRPASPPPGLRLRQEPPSRSAQRRRPTSPPRWEPRPGPERWPGRAAAPMVVHLARRSGPHRSSGPEAPASARAAGRPPACGVGRSGRRTPSPSPVPPAWPDLVPGARRRAESRPGTEPGARRWPDRAAAGHRPTHRCSDRRCRPDRPRPGHRPWPHQPWYRPHRYRRFERRRLWPARPAERPCRCSYRCPLPRAAAMSPPRRAVLPAGRAAPDRSGRPVDVPESAGRWTPAGPTGLQARAEPVDAGGARTGRDGSGTVGPRSGCCPASSFPRLPRT